MKCPHCHRDGYEPRDTYPSGEGYVPGLGAVRGWRFVKTGQFRAPQAGEWYLSGALPAAYCARSTLDTPYNILARLL